MTSPGESESTHFATCGKDSSRKSDVGLSICASALRQWDSAASAHRKNNRDFVGGGWIIPKIQHFFQQIFVAVCNTFERCWGMDEASEMRSGEVGIRGGAKERTFGR